MRKFSILFVFFLQIWTWGDDRPLANGLKAPGDQPEFKTVDDLDEETRNQIYADIAKNEEKAQAAKKGDDKEKAWSVEDLDEDTKRQIEEQIHAEDDVVKHQKRGHRRRKNRRKAEAEERAAKIAAGIDPDEEERLRLEEEQRLKEEREKPKVYPFPWPKLGECMDLESIGERYCMPKFMFVGASHAGTTALYATINQHPAISVRKKEPRWFGSHQRKDLGDYDLYLRTIMSTQQDDWQTAGDFSISLLADPVAPEQVKKYLPGIKIIMMLREPGEHCWSTTLYQERHFFKKNPVPRYREGETEPCPREALPHYHSRLDIGRYTNSCEQPDQYVGGIKRWREHFPEEDILILSSEEFSSEPVAVMRKIEKFLDLDPFEEYEPRRLNIHVLGQYEKRVMPSDRRAFFDRCFANTTDQVEELTGQKFYWRPEERTHWYKKDSNTLDWSRKADKKLYSKKPERKEEL
mmetsp:Transcript_3779/g.5607  ORF Transcript_3779/g.5607 Transcript_3779/m.5607 type:complete len:464 (-) Transcript_3779:307-1698(-)